MGSGEQIMMYDIEDELVSPRAARKNTRRVKQSSGNGKPPTKEKFVEERKVVSPLVPMNNLQAEYIRLIHYKEMCCQHRLCRDKQDIHPHCNCL